MADPGIIEVHGSDRDTFKRCRRKWNWSSRMRSNYVHDGPDKPAFFIGTGFHFALEDYWGYRRFDHPALAFAAYVDAQKPNDLPDDADELTDLAAGMLMYYADDWIREHPEPYETLWVDGKPQVEVEIAVDITKLLVEEADRSGRAGHRVRLLSWLDGRLVHYVMTLDRVVYEKREQTIAGVDYKSAANFDELNLITNPQAGAYDWGMDAFYTPMGYKPAGMWWQQHVKRVPAAPKLVNIGKKNEGLSLAFDQSTTYRLYRRAVVEHYGTIPERYNEILGFLADMQDDDGDRFVRRELLRRNDKQREAEQDKIIAEVLTMLDPDLPLYPTPTKDCSWDCPFRDPCIAKDDGSDYQFILDSSFKVVEGYADSWRRRIKYPTGSTSAPHSPAPAHIGKGLRASPTPTHT